MEPILCQHHCCIIRVIISQNIVCRTKIHVIMLKMIEQLLYQHWLMKSKNRMSMCDVYKRIPAQLACQSLFFLTSFAQTRTHKYSYFRTPIFTWFIFKIDVCWFGGNLPLRCFYTVWTKLPCLIPTTKLKIKVSQLYMYFLCPFFLSYMASTNCPSARGAITVS